MTDCLTCLLCREKSTKKSHLECLKIIYTENRISEGLEDEQGQKDGIYIVAE